MRTIILAIISSLCCFNSPLSAQEDTDALFLKEIHDHVLTSGKSFDWLEYLSEEIGGRLAGSEEAHESIQYTKGVLSQFADTVYLQECDVPYWQRGEKETVKIIDLSGREINIGGLALGNSVGTGPGGISAVVLEVESLDEVRELGRENVQGKIVFYNRAMDPKQINTFYAYGGAADQRVNGPAVAGEYGAVGVLVRSLTTAQDDVPHTGVTRYREGIPQIPAVAISTNDSDLLSKMLKNGVVKAFIETYCEMVSTSKKSYNVIAEIKGSQNPEQIILVGGHLDSWDVGGGAHDDGAGCVHSIQVFETLRALNYAPRHTLRCVMFMNEENGLGGGLAYAEESEKNGEFHVAAIESDAGGFTPRGFTFDAIDEKFALLFRQVTKYESLLETYHLSLRKGGSGADINPLKPQGGLLVGFRPDSQRYFDFHHTENDRIENVNERELKLGGAAMTSLVYLLDKYGLSFSDE